MMNTIRNNWRYVTIAVVILAVFVLLVAGSIPPNDFPKGEVITIQKNIGLNGIADYLQERRVIKSPFVYKSFVVLLGGKDNVMAGDYMFDRPQSVLRVAYRTIKGIQGLPRIKVTIPEGLASSDMAVILEREIDGFDTDKFRDLAKDNEGYLFPDTYFFYQNVSPDQVINEMRSNFDKRIRTLKLEITDFDMPIDDVIKMASIIEEEASNDRDRRIISGILWKRMQNKTPLQVDAPFFYLIGKTSAELSLDDLAMNSPYNLYKNLGLPPTPISNPGLGAILAALKPLETDYWFYLSDSEGNTHYAVTHDGHVANKQKYLQ